MRPLFFLFLLSLVCCACIDARDPDGYPRLIQGPMLGAVTSDAILIWTRASDELPVQLAYSTDATMADARMTAPVRATRANKFVAKIPVTGLEPNTTYYYRVYVGGEHDRYLKEGPPLTFRTAPGDDFRGRFTVAFGSCARLQNDPVQPIWDVVREWQPDLFFWLGDNVYGDTNAPEILFEELMRQRDVVKLQPIIRQVPQLAIWDDHDFGLNNHDGSNPQKVANLRMFTLAHGNPSYGLPDTPGLFFRWSYGGVDFIFLDGRYHRDRNDKPDGPNKTQLGASQLSWLKQKLKDSDAPFKVLISGGVFANAKGPTGDSWSAFLHERNTIFDFIRDEGIGGVVLLSGDTHTGELNCIPWSEHGGYDLYEFTASPLAQHPGNNWLYRTVEQRIRLPFNQSPNFGRLTFDFTGEEPRLIYNLIGMEGGPVWDDLVLTPADLRNGVSTWQEKQSAEAKRWMDAFNRRRHDG